ncbi:hypothetical protein EE36_12633 [Sulfitobacter sp. EE-36]|nr:hypothetical protein EE36_12633 [Sulfitobacter sp. EE-36]
MEVVLCVGRMPQTACRLSLAEPMVRRGALQGGFRGEMALPGVAACNKLFAQASKGAIPSPGASTSGTAIHNRA